MEVKFDPHSQIYLTLLLGGSRFVSRETTASGGIWNLTVNNTRRDIALTGSPYGHREVHHE